MTAALQLRKAHQEFPNDTRNAGGRSLEAVERELRALTGWHPPSEEDRRRRELEWKAEQESGLCGGCGRALAPGEAVYRITVFAGMTRLGGHSRRVVPRCKSCAVGYYARRPFGGALRFDPGQSCVRCERPVVNQWSWRRREHVLCSQQCTKAYWAAYRHERWAEAVSAARHKTRPVCGEVFDATRRDAVTCSPACRQKAYRRRLARGGR